MPGQTVPNLVIAKLGDGGRISYYSTTSTHVVIDILGYHDGSTGEYTPLTPTRVMDTRPGLGAPSPVPIGGTVQLKVAGTAGVPADAHAVVLNVTVTEPSGFGHVTVWPTGVPRPTASSLNFVSGQKVPNLVIVPIGTDGTISLHNGSATGTLHLVADTRGWY